MLDVHLPLWFPEYETFRGGSSALKAALLYADHVTLAVRGIAIADLDALCADGDIRELELVISHRAVSVHNFTWANVGVHDDTWTELRQTPAWKTLRAEEQFLSDRELDGLFGYEELFHLPEQGIPLLWPGSPSVVLRRVPIPPALLEDARAAGHVVFGDYPEWFRRALEERHEWTQPHWVAGPTAFSVRQTAAEVRLAGALLAEVPAFPDADIADVLDVRERLEPARARFSAAMARASHALADVTDDELVAAAAAHRREYVDDALAEICEEMEDLKVVPTLLRVTSDASTAALTASAAIAAMMLDPATVAAAATSATAVSATARETLARRKLRREIRRQPYWYLHEADRVLGRRR